MSEQEEPDRRETTVAALTRQLEELRAAEREARLRLSDQQRLIEELQARLLEWEEARSSPGFRLLERLRAWRLKITPPGSRRARFIQRALDGLVLLREEGLLAFARAALAALTPWRAAAPGVAEHNRRAYGELLERTALGEEQLLRQREEAAALAYRPLVSVVTPVFNPHAGVLRDTIESVLRQTYDRWELCLADGASDAPGVREVLEEYLRRDGRIRVQRLERNLGISGNSNAALALAGGEFVQFLDHDDILAPDALFEAVRRLNEDRRLDVVYYDEDKLAGDGSERRDPFFKPDWSPETLLSVNYLTHALLRRSLVAEAGGFDPTLEGAQDWDLALRVSERTNAIAHVPRVLYHWRQVAGSTAAHAKAKPWAFEAQVRSVANHLRRGGLAGASVDFAAPGVLRARWPVSGRTVSIVIPTKDNAGVLRACLASILARTAYPRFEIVLVDNGSSDPETLRYYETLRRDRRISFVDYPERFNYSRANNLGARGAGGELLLFLNNDVEVLDADWLEELARWAERPGIGIVGAKLLYPDGTIQHAGVVLGMEGHASHVFWGEGAYRGSPYGSFNWYRNYSAVTGACMMLRREVFDEIGGFDEEYALAFSDVEICVRAARRGYRVLYTPFARLTHHEGKTRGRHIPAGDMRLGHDHLAALIEAGDPFFNPNLSYAQRTPRIARDGEEPRLARLGRLVERAERQSGPAGGPPAAPPRPGATP
ncbi:MAG TPA: glycosyltransferase [Candidatus Methanoperedens sp.]|nr:glycosyltransferase [Candidatus Methanoperedens sp.]